MAHRGLGNGTQLWRRAVRIAWVGAVLIIQLPKPMVRAAAAAQGKQVLRGHMMVDFARASSVGKLPDNAVLHLAIGLPSRSASQMETELEDIYNPRSSKFHHFLTPGQFAQKFGASDTDYQSLITFARANGLAVSARFPDRLLLGVTGSAAAVNKAFHLTLTTRLRSDGSVFYAPDREPSIDLDAKVLHVSGLDNFVLPRSASSGGSGPSGSLGGTDFRNAYLPGLSLTGHGQSVGLFELDGFYQADIAAYVKLFRTDFAQHVPQVKVAAFLDGFVVTPSQSGPPRGGCNPGKSIPSGAPPAGTPGGAEPTADIEVLMAIAPGLDKRLRLRRVQ